MGLLTWLLESRNYMPHGHCYLWQPAVLWLNVGSDAVIAGSYFTIPAIIGTYLYRRRSEIRLVWVPVLFAAFILLCGFTHAFEVWTAWNPDYRLAGVVKALTAIASAGTAASLLFVMPKAMALRTPGQLEAEVQLRIAELHAANLRLEQEVLARSASELALQATEERLRAADRRKDEFLATLAHELRNPLAPITNSVALMHTVTMDEPVLIRARDVISRQVTQMIRLIDDLMDVSRIAGNRLLLQIRPVVLQEVLAQALETVQHAVAAQRLRVEQSLPSDPVVLRGDEARLQQVFVNLLTNSVRYTPPGGLIALEASVVPGGVAVAVRDTGDGITEDDMPHIFELFTRAGTASGRARDGLGIGLALTRRLVEMHGGTVNAFSPGRGKGSRFVVSLPVGEGGGPMEVPDVGAVPAVTLAHRRVLVVDDNADAADTLAQWLSSRGCAVWRASDGLDAIRLCEAIRPDIVFMDLGLPIVDGWEATRRLRSAEWGREVVVVAVSGWAQASDRERSLDAGFDLHIAKPIAPELAVQLAAGFDPDGLPLRRRRSDRHDRVFSAD